MKNRLVRMFCLLIMLAAVYQGGRHTIQAETGEYTETYGKTSFFVAEKVPQTSHAAGAFTDSVMPVGVSASVMPTGASASVMPVGVSASATPAGVSASVMPTGASASVMPVGVSASVMPVGASALATPAGASASVVSAGASASATSAGVSASATSAGVSASVMPVGAPVSVLALPYGWEESWRSGLSDSAFLSGQEERTGETSETEEEDAQEKEYENLAIADVTDYVNVRSIPSTDGEIVGKIYDGAVAQIIETAGEEQDWFHVTSGTVEGYIKAEYFIYGQAALEVIDEYVTKYVQVQADRLNVRKEQDITSKRVGYLNQGEKALLLEHCGDWLKIQYGQDGEGYVAAQYVMIKDEFTYARSLEEERQERERRKALQERQKTSEESVPEKVSNVKPPNTDYASNAELREQIVAYAMQFLGTKYVHGGSSLTEGTDCSGFTSLIYAAFGYSIGRTPSGQLSSAGRGIDYSELQKGDIICYGKKGKCTHVALYIGDGQIIHEANARKGVVIYQADYDTILGVRNVID